MAAAPASAQVVEGQRADAAGDQVIDPVGAASGLDLSGVVVRYDSGAGEVRITYRGTIKIMSHSSTAYSGVIGQTSSATGCGVLVRGDATFSGRTFDSSGGGNPGGTGRLEVKGVGPVDGVVLLPSDGSVVFVFTSALLRGLDYRCAGALHARWVDSTNATTDDEVASFDLSAPPPVPGDGSAGPGGAGITSADDSAVATGGPASAAGSSLLTDPLVVSQSLTARLVGAHGGLRGLLGRGLTVPVVCSAECTAGGRVTSGGTIVARGSVVRLKGGRATLRLRVDPSARWLLAHRASVPLTIVVTISDADGTSRTLVRRLLLR